MRSDRRGAVWIGATDFTPMKAIARRCGSCQAGLSGLFRIISGHSIPVLRSICILIRIIPPEYHLILILRHICGEIGHYRSNVPCTIQNAANRTVDTLKRKRAFSIRFCCSGLVRRNRSRIVQIAFYARSAAVQVSVYYHAHNTAITAK